jgi:hypothetical protein
MARIARRERRGDALSERVVPGSPRRHDVEAMRSEDVV